MKLPRPTLSLKILLVAFLNIALLALVFSVFARSQFRLDLGSFFLTPARDRMLSVSRLLALQLVSSTPESWTRTLDQASETYPAHFYLFNEFGEQIAGQPVKLPEKFVATFRDNENRHRFRREWEGGGFRPPPPPGTSPSQSSESDPGADFGRFNREHPDLGRSESMGRPENPGSEKTGSDNPAFEYRGPENSRSYRGRPELRRPEMPQIPQLNLTKVSDPPEYWASVHIPWFPQRAARSGAPPMHAMIVWRFSNFWTQPFFFDLKVWLGVVAATILVSVACWLPLVRGLTRAIAQLTAATGRISEGHFEIQVATRRKDELGSLSDSISRMAQRLSGLVHGQRRFLSDIAHELSSPIARAQLAIGILEQRAGATQVEYVADLREEVEHMSSLVSELLAFSKSQSIDSSVELKNVNVADTVRRVLQRESSDDVLIETQIDAKAEVIAQPDYLFRSLANLVRNAVRYASHAGPILVSATERGDEVTITVADNGPGLPENELENVFRPFYRPEFARQRETGGAGLGLAIVRSCIEACGGAVTCRNRTPKGLEVAIRLARVHARDSAA